jgi:hypothetical protein
MICGHEHTLPFMDRLRLQARSAVGGMGTSRDLHCVTQPSNSMAMFSLSSPLPLSKPFPSKIKQNDFHVTNQTSDALPVQAIEFLQAELHRFLQKNVIVLNSLFFLSKKFCNSTKFTSSEIAYVSLYGFICVFR